LFTRPLSWVTGASLAIVAGWAVAAGAQQRPQTNLPLDPPRERGASITPAYEGWYPNPDGSFSMLIGYYNRNTKEALDIPVGPNNRVEPGGPDQGQPTHFEIGRQWGVFVVKVPKDFGNKAVTWTIVSNGETQSIPFTLNKGYPISPLKELGMGNKVELNVAAERLRAEKLLSKSASSPKLFKKYPELFLLTPEKTPNKVQYVGPMPS